MATFDANRFKREMQAAQRRAEAEVKRQVDAINRKNQQVQRTNAHNAKVVGDLQRRLRSSGTGTAYTPNERVLADRVQEAIVAQDPREWDAFLSYARIDGAQVGDALRQALEALGVRVWFDEIAIIPGKSQSLQMDQGLRKARAGVVLLTPAYLVGRFWTERELGALLRKNTLIPVLHQSTFEQVSEYSGILPDLAGFETARDSIATIAEKIAAAILPPERELEEEPA